MIILIYKCFGSKEVKNYFFGLIISWTAKINNPAVQLNLFSLW